MSQEAATTAERHVPGVLRLARWTCSTGSNMQRRGAVVLELGDGRRQASAEGNGPVDALYRAVDRALADVLHGRPRLLAYDVHALGEGTDADAAVTVRLAPGVATDPSAEAGFEGRSQSPNLVAASVEAYIAALDALIAAVWRDTAAGGEPRDDGTPGSEYDSERARVDVQSWFDR
jgi:2-isopropylmalate synthase